MPYNQYRYPLERGVGFYNFFRSNFNDTTAANYDYTVKNESMALIPSNSYGALPTGILPYNPSLHQGYYTGNAAHAVFSYTGALFPSTLPDSTYFTIEHVITTTGDLHNSNDTLIQIQKFGKYYAYDDGSAELGYYLNAYGAKTAVRFTLNEADTLKSVRIYFDPIIDGTAIQASGFRIVVWNNIGGAPGTIIHKDSVIYPFYLSGSYDKMPTFNLSSCLPLGVGTYFIGIQQTSNKALNIGFDRNTNHKDALYYDIGNGWVQSAIPGSLMINPVMGCTYPAYVGIKEFESKNNFQIFPNPAQNTISVNHVGNQLETSTLQILTSLGQLVFTKSITSNETIDISSLSNGLYFIHLKNSNLNVSSQKLIISK